MNTPAPTAPPFATRIGEWAAQVRFDDLPADVVEATRLRVLDVVGLALAGSETAFGRATAAATVALSPPGPSRIFGSGRRVGAAAAAFVNAACAQALEFDDTHNGSIVHMSSPAVAAALALAEMRVGGPWPSADGPDVRDRGRPDAGPAVRRTVQPMTGRELILVIAVANEISCRVGMVAPGQFHRRGFHPTGLFAPFGIAYLACRVLGLDADTMARAAGICGSTAAGLLECWVDGTQSKFLHSGWAAQNGIAAAFLAAEGVTGPPAVLEGRFGLFASHLQDAGAAKDFERLCDRLGEHWESRNSSFKPYPAAHVLHPYLDALFRARAQHNLTAADVVEIECPVAEFNVSIVCEPVAEKVRPASDSHGRVSLQFTLAEAMCRGSLGKDAYSVETLADREILSLAQRVRYYVDPTFPGPGRFKGAVRVTLRDGRVISEIQEYNRGSVENPMTIGELRAKFDENVRGVLGGDTRNRLADLILNVEREADATRLVDLATPTTAA